MDKSVEVQPSLLLYLVLAGLEGALEDLRAAKDFYVAMNWQFGAQYINQTFRGSALEAFDIPERIVFADA